MRIVMVFDNYAPYVGGAEVLYQRLAEGLAARGHEVHVVTQRYPNTLEVEERAGTRIHRIQAANRYLFTVRSIPMVWRLSRNADLIQTATYNSALAAHLAAWRWRKPAVLTVLEVLGDLWTTRFEMGRVSAGLHQAFERFVVGLPFSRFVCISQATARALRSARPSLNAPISVIPCGIDPSEWRRPDPETRRRIRTGMGISHDQFLYLYYGRPGISKGVEYLVEAIASVRQRLPSSRAVLILAREPADRYRSILRRIRELELDGHIQVVEPRPRGELPEYVGSADCVVVPSLSEGFGFTAVEACALGVPVVVTRAGSLPEVVSGRVIFAEPANPESLASGIVAAANEQWLQIPEKHFSWEASISAYESLYRELVESRIADDMP